jgi:hypothetical protein
MAAPLQGPFETHLTLATTRPHEELERFAATHRLKFTHILLSRGRQPSQPMLTRHASGTLAGELAAAHALAATCAASGFAVTRIKIEVAPDNPHAPVHPEQITPETGYWEHHVKLLLPPDADLPALAAIARPHGAHLSRNARRIRTDAHEERFLTQRLHQATRDQARAALDALLAVLHDHTLLQVEEEFVVHDSNLALDAGWISPEGPP